MPAVSNVAPSILQQTPQQVSSFIASTRETQQHVEAPKNNGIERPQTPPPREASPPREDEHPFEISAPEPQKQNKVIDHEKMKYYRNPAFRHPVLENMSLANVARFQQQNQQIQVNHERERTPLETHQSVATNGTIHEHLNATRKVPEKLNDTVTMYKPLKHPEPEIYKPRKEDKFGNAEEMRQKRVSIFDKPAVVNDIHESLEKKEKKPEVNEIHQAILTPKPMRAIRLKFSKPLGTPTEPREVDLDLITPTSTPEPRPEPPMSHVKHDKLQTALNTKNKKELQEEMRRVELKPFFGKGEKTKAVMKDELLRLHHTKPELFYIYK